MALGLLGILAVAVSLLMGLWMQHVRERPVYERPAALIRPVFRLLWWPIQWALFLAGLGAGRSKLLSGALGRLGDNTVLLQKLAEKRQGGEGPPSCWA